MQITNFKEQVIQLEPVHVKRFVLKNMFFATDKTKILSSSEPALMELYSLLQDNPNIRIRIIGHTDDVGKDDYNQRLSQARAEAVVSYLVSKGIEKERLTAVGYGESEPKEVNKKVAEQYEFLEEGDSLTEEFINTLEKEQQELCHQLNRRTEFRVVRTTYGLYE
jgi:outer membrane protein OmpA-like peptidoglycan-associated protein